MRKNLSLVEIMGFALSMAIVVVAGRAYATVLYDSGGHDNGGPNWSNGSEMTMWIEAEDFALASPATITDVRFWTIQQPSQPGYNGSIVWTLYSDAGGSPGGILDRGTASATRVDTGSGLWVRAVPERLLPRTSRARRRDVLARAPQRAVDPRFS
jgi:hypothetical protein